MKRNIFRAVIAALLSVVMIGTNVVRPKPAQAIPIVFDVGTFAVAAVVALFGSSGGTKRAGMAPN